MEYESPDHIIMPRRDILFCENCGKSYGNCEHYPMIAKHVVMSKEELKKIMES